MHGVLEAQGRLKKRHPKKSNVLLVNITRLGDMLQATPTIAGLKAENPDCKVTVLVEKQFEAVCHSIPHIDSVRALDLGLTVRALAREQDGIVDAFEYVTDFVGELRKERFDYCLNMSSSAYTALLLKLVGIERNGGWTSDDEGHRVIESDWARLFATSVFHQNRQYNSLNLVDVFRCSADVEEHPRQLLIKVEPDAKSHAENLLREAAFTNSGPLIAIQAGASQEKRQWSPRLFSRLLRYLLEKSSARIVLTGTKKELSIIGPIVQDVGNPNVFCAAGKTSIPQLAALLKECDVLVTGDTGTMHMAVAVGTPVVSMFLASAFGFETGPYSEDNIVLQPVIGCGPCNPNKPCSGLECHDTIEPELVAELVLRRLQGSVRQVPASLADPRKVIVYRSFFDRFGFCDLEGINQPPPNHMSIARAAYRKLWLDDLGGYPVLPVAEARTSNSLRVISPMQEGLGAVIQAAQQGQVLNRELITLIKDARSSVARLGEVNRNMTELDRQIEELGFHHAAMGPVTRMFLFSKENLSGTEPLSLASQMLDVYESLERRAHKLGLALSEAPDA
jgi:ADP-heptose:LPS heptosyltransferase